MTEDIRWKQRFENFEKAYERFTHAVEATRQDAENDLYQMALIQSFEFTYELAWKTMKDYLKFKGIKAAFPRDVIKQAFMTGIIQDGQTWIDMMDDRNKTVHTYSEEQIKKILDRILNQYPPVLAQVYGYFKEQP